MAQVTQLSVSGTPGAVQSFLAKVDGGTSRPNKFYTALSPSGTPGGRYSFVAKTEVSVLEKTATDTLRLSISDSMVGEQEIVAWDVVVPVITTAWGRTNSTEVPYAVSLVPVIRETATVQKSSTSNKVASDTLSISMTAAAVSPVPDAPTGTDTLSISSTEVASVSVSQRLKEATDTLNLTAGVTSLVTAIMSQEVPATDTLAIRVSTVGNVSVETLYREINMEITWPNWDLSLRLR